VKNVVGVSVIEAAADLPSISSRSQMENPSLRASMVATLLPGYIPWRVELAFDFSGAEKPA